MPGEEPGLQSRRAVWLRGGSVIPSRAHLLICHRSLSRYEKVPLKCWLQDLTCCRYS